ncbi:hypothetical protein [Saccharopolyspora hattusasensis]|uniref:hypothetical protein n=1 Tax=Saccharopolyspora hattusasensis TaxID=1128679 RepID=UPI003D9768BF
MRTLIENAAGGQSPCPPVATYPEAGEGQLTDELLGQVVAAVRPARPTGHGSAWEALEAQRDRIAAWVGQGLTVVKIEELLVRQGVRVPYRTLHRFCLERTDYRGRAARETVRVADGTPGEECQIDRPDGPALRSLGGSAAGGARADLHCGVLPTHVRVADLHPDPGGDHRWV